jgi:hypothetical protein
LINLTRNPAPEIGFELCWAQRRILLIINIMPQRFREAADKLVSTEKALKKLLTCA